MRAPYLSFGLSHVILCEKELAVEIAHVDGVHVNLHVVLGKRGYDGKTRRAARKEACGALLKRCELPARPPSFGRTGSNVTGYSWQQNRRAKTYRWWMLCGHNIPWRCF